MAIYYVSNLGNDSLAGTSEATAWQTCSKVNSYNFLPGDRIRFQRGGKWNEVLIPPSSGIFGNPIVFEHYGIGAKSIITGEIIIEDWVSEGGNIYSKTDPLFNNLQLLTIDANTREKGRFPKDSYITVTSATANTSVTSTETEWTSAPNFTGGEIVITKVSWIQDRGFISSHSGNTLNYTGTSSYNASVGWGFFVQNHPNCLTEFGDWWFDNGAKKLYMHFGSELPSNHVVKVANNTTVLDLTGKDYNRFEYLDIRYGLRECIGLTNAENNYFYKCDIKYAGNRGAQHYDTGGFSDGTTFDQCRFRDTYNNAVKANNNSNVTVKECDIQRNYMHAGTTDNGDGQGAALAFGVDNFRGDNNFAIDNRIEYCGYHAIQFAMSNVFVNRNDIYKPLLVREDGGAIYCFGPASGDPFVNREIIDNVIIDVLPLGVPNGYNTDEVYSIYLDEHSEDVTVEGNIIINAVNGVYLHTAPNNFVLNNQIYNTTHSSIFLKSNSLGAQSSGNTVSGNIVKPLSGRQIKFVSPVGLGNFGNFTQNSYFRHSEGEQYDINYGATVYTSLASYVSALGYDSDSTISPLSSDPVPVLYPFADPVSVDPFLEEEEPPVEEPEEPPVEEPEEPPVEEPEEPIEEPEEPIEEPEPVDNNMDYYKNIDQLCEWGLPAYNTYPSTSGLQISFINEDDYEEPVTLEGFKDHSYIDDDTDDNLVALYLKAARIDVENYLQKSLGVRTIKLLAMRLPKNYRLPWAPVESITTTGYTLFGDIVKEGGTEVTIEYKTNASLVNDSIKHAIYKQAFNYYENRDSNQSPELESIVKMILNKYRRVQFP